MNLPLILACATCMGAPGHQNSIAAGNAILVMLWLLVGVAIMFGGFVFTLARRAAKHAREHGIPTAPDPMDAYSTGLKTAPIPVSKKD